MVQRLVPAEKTVYERDKSWLGQIENHDIFQKIVWTSFFYRQYI